MRRTPAQWAAANGHTEVATLLAGAARSEEAVGRASFSVSTQGSKRIIHTGIKALDLFAPLVKGGIVRFPFVAGVGMVVLLSELCHRFLAMDSGRAIWTGFTQPPFDFGDWKGEMAETGLAGRVKSSLVGFDESPAARREAFCRGLDQMEALRDSGHEVLAVILSAQGFEHEVESSFMRLKAPSAKGSITSIIVTPFPGKRDAWEDLQAPYTGQIALDRARAQQHLFPAIPPRFSISRGFDGQFAGEHHSRLAETSRALLDQYQQQDPGFRRLEEDLGGSSRKGQRLARFMCQPFFVTEPFTGIPGAYVTYGDLLSDLAVIID